VTTNVEKHGRKHGRKERKRNEADSLFLWIFYYAINRIIHAVTTVCKKMNLSLKDKQQEAIVAFMSGNDVFVALPTGYGKSLIYGLLPLTFDEFKGAVSVVQSKQVSEAAILKHAHQ
jgi:superfamily II DNA helicase RecQ